jgi:UDP-2,4-diacetamido-2,4,6-trideoxy-beta-L-altropyranose hydrolase
MRACFRVDASRGMGVGHVMRCLSLADALSDVGTESTFICGAQAGEWVEQRGYRHSPVASPLLLDAEHTSDAWRAADVAATRAVIEASGERPDWLIVDHYAIDQRWHHALRDISQRLAVIDDLADRNLDCDLLIDHNQAADHLQKYAGRIGKSTRVLGGPRYALLKPQFVTAARYTWRPRVASIGIFMGGADQPNLSAMAFEACRTYAGFDGDIEIAATRMNPHLSSLQALVAADPRASLTLDQPDLTDFFARHDLQIGAGGGATWERCCIGAPAVTLAYAENQWVPLRGLAELGILVTPEPTPSPSVEEIGRVVGQLINDPQRRRQLAARAREVVDGLGAKRVSLAMAGSALQVRVATVADAQLMHEWRNDPATRAVSIDSNPIALESHLRWLQATLADARRTLLIGTVGNIAVGVIRFDELADSTEVSLYLDPGLNGFGLGRSLLLAGESFEVRRRAQAVEFIATIKEQNRASIHMFESAGYAAAGPQCWKKRRVPGSEELS